MTRACWTASICAASTSSVGSTADSKPCSDGRAVRLQVPNTTIKRCQVPPTFLAYSKSRSRAAHQRVRLGAVVGGLGSGHPVASAIVVSPSSILGTGRTHIRPAGLAAPPSPTRPSCQRSDGQEASGFGPALTARRGTRMTFKTDCSQRAVVAVGQDSRPCQAVDHARRNQMHFRGQPGPELAERLAWHIPFDPRPSRLAHERRAGGTHACGQAADSCQPTNHI